MGPGPTIRRRQLAVRMRQLREAAGKTPKQAAEWLEVSTSTLSKMELGRQAIRPPHVRLLCQLYGVESPEVDALLRLSREANQRGWWMAYGDTVPDWFRDYVGLESDAAEVWAHELGLVHGLLQTPAYARALLVAGLPDASPGELDRMVEFRQARQARLRSDDPPTLRVVMDEAVLRRIIGGVEVMRDQLAHLVEVSQLPHVTIQVHPFTAGAHPALGTPFTLLRFPDTPDVNVVYLENDRGALYLERPADVARYAEMFEQASRSALSPEESRGLITKVMDDL